MAKLKHLLPILFVLTHYCAAAQPYRLQFTGVDHPDPVEKAGLQTLFPGRHEASLYVTTLPAALQARGYLAASVDSALLDSAGGRVRIFLGEQYRWAQIRTQPAQAPILEAVRWYEGSARGPLDFALFSKRQQQILDYLEGRGHPFGKVYLDSISIEGDAVSGLLVIDQGPAYVIDSIRVFGDVRLSNLFLQRYLDIPAGSPYNRNKLEAVSRRLRELSYLEEERPSDVTLLGTGSVLNLYLKPRRSSQVNALVGFLPNSTSGGGSGKLQLTVDANILLRNALGGGETIGLLWQQLQQQSPRLNLLFEQPYMFRSRFGLNFSLDMYKRDSAFLNLNMSLGTTYRLSERQAGTLFVQRRQTIVSTVNTARVLQTRQLPPEADVSSLNLGVSYEYNSTDYRPNPRRGGGWNLTASAGTKTIKKNAQILQLEDPSNPSFKFESLYDTVRLKVYQFRVQAAGARYFPLGGQSTIKAGLQAGVYGSANYFRNELFLVGGYKLMRGFDEESQFVSRFAIGTLEYRYLIGQNSAFFGFVDGGYGYHQGEGAPHHTYMGTGLGLSFETGAGVFNLAWAIGKRNDSEWNLRQSKVHLGFASYF